MSQSIKIPVTQVGLEASIAAAMKRVGSSSQINLGTNSRQINALSQPLGRITGQADEFSKSMGAANARVLAFGASAGIIYGVSRAMSGLVKSTIQVEKSLVEINAVLGESGAELDKFGQGIFNVAKNTGKSFGEVATGALELARQGLSAEDTLARLNDALILSRLSGLDATKSVEGLTAAFNSFKSSGISTAEILDNIVAVSQKFAVSEKDIIEGLGRSASVADLAGVSFNELASIITAIQEKTARGGAVIGNSLKTIFARIQDKAVLSDLQDMGIAVTGLQGEVLPALKILENLAAQMGSFSQIEQADIAKKLGGVYQLDKLLAALKDLSSESSVYRAALKEIETAGGSAYKKNAVLNETLASIINKVTVSAEQLGAKLGEIGVTDSLKNILGFFNNLLEGIQKVLGEESGLGTLVKGLVKGLGNLFAGPGLALFGAIILKLSKDLIQFGFASLKAFFGIGQAAKEVQNVESAISQVLARNVGLQQQLFALEGNRAGQLKLITGALVEQEALLRRSANISSGLAAPLYNVGVRASDSGLRIKNKAGGYMPAVAKESQAINGGVGGARRGDKPVVMPNFNFGQGKKGTVVAHTGEYVVPNFGGGKGSAIFNRDMVQKMGLPDGAQKITASGGLIPNFAIRGLASNVSVLSGRVFESMLRDDNFLNLTENDILPDVRKGKYAEAEAKMSVDAALKDSNFGPQGRKGNVLIVPKDSSKQDDELLIAKKNSIIRRPKEDKFLRGNIFATARKVLQRENSNKNTDYSKIPLNAFSGFIPNFAPKFNAETVRQYANDIERYKSPTKDFYDFPDGSGGYGANVRLVLSRSQSKAVSNKQEKEKKISDKGFYNLDADALGGILLVSPRFGKSKGSLNTSMPIGKIPFFNQEKSPSIDKNKYIKLNGIKTANTPSGRDLQALQGDISQLFAGGIVDLAYKLYGSTFDPASGGEFASKLKSLDPSKKQQLLPAAAQGDLFEAAGKVALNSFANLESLFGSAEQSRPFDFQNASALQKMFGVNAKRGEAKRGGEKNFSSSDQVSGIVKKVFNDPEYSLTALESLRGQGAFNFSKAQKAASAANAFGGFVPNFVNQKYIIETLARIKAGTSGFSKQEQETFLSKFGARSTGGKLSIRDVFNKLDGEMGISQLIDGAYRSAGPTASTEDVFKVFEKQTKANPNPLRSLVSKKGYVPNFANPLQDAVGREMAAGVPASQIYVDKSPSLKNAANPMGLMVANRRDEPAGGFQGINRARKEGTNPMMYGAAGGFVPNYVNYGPGTIVGSSGTSSGVRSGAATSTTALVDSTQEVVKGNRDMLGTIFAVQSALSVLTGATEGATGGLGAFANGLSSAAGTATTALFASQGLSQAFGGAEKGVGKFLGKLGPYGAAAAFAFAGYQELTKYLDKTNPAIQKAGEAMSRVSEAASKAAINLNTLNPAAQEQVKKEAKSIINEARAYTAQTYSPYGLGSSTEARSYGYEGVSSELKDGFENLIAQARGVGVSRGEIDKLIKTRFESDGKMTADEVEQISNQLSSQISNIAKEGSPQSIIRGLSEDQKKQFAAMTPEEVEKSIAARGKTSKGSVDARTKLKPLQDAFYQAGISGDVARQEAIRKTIELLQDQAKAEEEAQKEAIGQTKTSIVQDKLKNAITLSIAKARSFENDILGQQLLKGQELGNLSETALRNIQDEIALREINRELQDGTANLIQEQISQAKKITSASEDAKKLQEKLNSLSSEDLQKREVVNGLLEETSKLLQQTTGLTEQQKIALQITLDKLFDENGIKKENLTLTQKQTGEYKEQARQLDLISQASKRALEAQSFNREIGATKSINANDLQVRALESSKLGASDTQVRQIDQQIAAIKENTVALEQGKEREKIFSQLKSELLENNKIADETTRKIRDNKIQQVSTPEALARVAKQVFLQQEDVDKGQQQQNLEKFIQNMNQLFDSFDVSNKIALAVAADETKNAGRIAPVIDALEMFRRSLLETSQIIDQKIEDIKLQQLTSISGREILAGDYDIETLRQQAGKTKEEAARIARERQNKSVSQLFNEEYGKTAEEQALDLKKTIVDGSVQFKNNMIEAMMGAIEGTGSLKDGLRSAAYEFVKTINQRMMSQLVDKIVGGSVQSGGGGGSGGLIQGIGSVFSSMFGSSAPVTAAAGGMINGGSGSKDDVPAMLMGGEYVVNKKAVSKYGAQFLESVNNGTLTGYAQGGSVQRGPQGNFYTPGTFGQGAIEGKRNLLDFATQTGTTGQFDKMINQSGYQAVDLEPESSKLSVSGMRNSPQFAATQSAKEQAFDLYLQQYNAEQEAAKAKKEAKKAFRKQLMMLAISAVAAPVIQAGAAGFKEAFKNAAGQGLSKQLLAGVKGIGVGSNGVGGLTTLFSSVGKTFAGDFRGAGAEFQRSQGIIPKAIPVSEIGNGQFSASGIGPGYTQRDIEEAIKIQRENGIFESDIETYLSTLKTPKQKSGFFESISKGLTGLFSKKTPSSSNRGYLGATGPFDKYGNYIDDWADNPQMQKTNQRAFATGGMIPSTSGIDTVPAMLSGGEFVMNRSAVQGIGAPSLQSMNSGGTSITSEEISKELNEKLLAKLDELIKASGSTGDITINVDSSGKSTENTSGGSSEERQNFARQIRAAVLQVINDEKRIGGTLRR